MNRLFTLLGLGLLFFPALAPRAGASQVKSPGRAATIVTFGDSVTARRAPTTVYSTILANELTFEAREVTVINAGIGGNTTKNATARFEKDVLSAKPDVVVLMFGINDSAMDVWKNPAPTGPRVSLPDYRQNLTDMVQQLKQRHCRVVLMTPNPIYWAERTRERYAKPPYVGEDVDGFNLFLRDYAEAVREIAQAEKVGLVDVYAAFKAAESVGNRRPGALARDGMHPDDEGHRIMAELLITHLTTADRRFARKPFTAWTRSGDVVTMHPRATNITHDAAGPAVLGPALVKLGDGAVMSVYSTPTSYAGKPGECYIAGRITRDGGRTWEPERELTRLPQGRSAHPTVCRARDGTLHLVFLGYQQHAWDKATGNPTSQTRSDLWTARSTDGGATWTAPLMVFQGYTGSTNGIAETHDGALVAAFSHYVANPGRLVSRAVVSRDGGKSWQVSNALDIGGAGDHEGALEPCVIELKDKRLWMLIRTSRKFFWESFSTDGGLTWWAAQATKMDSSHSPGHLTRLSDGRLALVFNPSATQRRELHVALSSDEGRTWSPSLTVAKGYASYGFVMENQPGELWVGFIDAHGGWGTKPRARHLKIAVEDVLAAGKPAAAKSSL
ncbi:MAG: hypothetical protein RIQ93_103 [Verrucomicrobiota bacterium]|jgi:lysophospholipase L1-like esterase